MHELSWEIPDVPRLIEKYRFGTNLSVDEADMVARVPEIGARLIANL